MSYSHQTIRIDDLREPQLEESARRDIEEALIEPTDVTVQHILAQASEEAGLRDFGPNDFRSRLNILLKIIKFSPGMTALARHEHYRRLIDSAYIRLHLQEILNQHPAIFEEEISQPIVIVGAARSGTTHLQGLLGADSRLRAFRNVEMFEPILYPYDKIMAETLDARRRRYIERSNRALSRLPYSAAMHSPAPEDVAEDMALQRPNFPIHPGDIARIERDQSIHDPIPCFGYMKTALKAMQWQHRGQPRPQWILKSPLYCVYIPEILESFPDALIVMTHRDPVALVQSWATLHCYGSRIRYEEVDVDAIFLRAVEETESWLQSMIAFRHLIPEKQLVDIRFHEFMNDQLGTAKSIMRLAGLTSSPSQVNDLVLFLKQHSRGRFGRIKYRLSRDFGVSAAQLRQRFEFYTNYFTNIESEV